VSTHQHRRLLDRQTRDQRRQLLAGVLLARSQRLTERAGALLERERLHRLLRLDHRAEEPAE
jgi:hypothetical protein